MYIRQKLKAVSCQLVQPSHSISAMMHVYGAANGGYVIGNNVLIVAMSLITHIKPIHAPLSQPLKDHI